jgi:hypothetical protein
MIIRVFWISRTDNLRQVVNFTSDIMTLTMDSKLRSRMFISILMLSNDYEFEGCISTLRSCRDCQVLEDLEYCLLEHPEIHSRVMDLLFNDARLVLTHISGFHFILLDTATIERILDCKHVNTDISDKTSFVSLVNKLRDMLRTSSRYRFNEKLRTRMYKFTEDTSRVDSILSNMIGGFQNKIEYFE